MRNANFLILLGLLGVILIGCCEAKSKDFKDEEKVKAVKRHVDESNRLLEKRSADGSLTSTSTSTTTTSPKSSTTTASPVSSGGGTTTTTKSSTALSTTRKSSSSKPKRKGTDSPASSTTSTTAAPTKSSGKDNETSSPSTTTKKPDDLPKDLDNTARKELKYWQDQEKVALAYAVAGVDSWLKVFKRLGRTQLRFRLGELLYRTEKMRIMLGQRKVDNYIKFYRMKRRSG